MMMMIRLVEGDVKELEIIMIIFDILEPIYHIYQVNQNFGIAGRGGGW